MLDKNTDSLPQKKTSLTVSAIVPIFNEEKTVDKVIGALLKSPLISEVICVNDGSTDGSLNVLKKFGKRIEIINLEKNHGKGFALAAGIRKAKGQVVAFVDGDFINLSPEHVKQLLTPIISKEFEAVVGYSVSHKGLPDFLFYSLSGQRAYRRQTLIPYLEQMESTRFGIEIFLNKLAIAEIRLIPLNNLIGLSKYEKRNLTVGSKEYLIEAWEIIKQIKKNNMLLIGLRSRVPELFKMVNSRKGNL